MFEGTDNARDLKVEPTAFYLIVFVTLLSEFLEALQFRYASLRD